MEEKKSYPKVRNLDGCYYRVERDGESMTLSFTDLTKAEQNKFLDKLDVIGLKRMTLMFAEILRAVGDTFDILGEEKEESDE